MYFHRLVVAAGLCLIVAGVALADVREPIAKATRYTARRGTTNLPSPQPTTIAECRTKVEAAIEAEGQTRTTGSITYQCITTESWMVFFQPAPVAGSAVLSWVAPTKNTDGSDLTDLAGYRISYGTIATALAQTIQVPAVLSYTVTDLPPGTYYFAVRAYTAGGKESALSDIAQKAVL